MTNTADIVICGAGIAGISAAYQLAVKQDPDEAARGLLEAMKK